MDSVDSSLCFFFSDTTQTAPRVLAMEKAQALLYDGEIAEASGDYDAASGFYSEAGEICRAHLQLDPTNKDFLALMHRVVASMEAIQQHDKKVVAEPLLEKKLTAPVLILADVDMPPKYEAVASQQQSKARKENAMHTYDFITGRDKRKRLAFQIMAGLFAALVVALCITAIVLSQQKHGSAPIATVATAPDIGMSEAILV